MKYKLLYWVKVKMKKLKSSVHNVKRKRNTPLKGVRLGLAARSAPFYGVFLFLSRKSYRFFPTFRLETINTFEYFFGVRVF
jgi:hypothetical protein